MNELRTNEYYLRIVSVFKLNKINNMKDIIALNLTPEETIKIKRGIYIENKKQHIELIKLILKSSIKQLKLGNYEFLIKSYYSRTVHPNYNGYLISLLENNSDFKVIRLFLKINCNILLSHKLYPNGHPRPTGIIEFIVKITNYKFDHNIKINRIKY